VSVATSILLARISIRPDAQVRHPLPPQRPTRVVLCDLHGSSAGDQGPRMASVEEWRSSARAEPREVATKSRSMFEPRRVLRGLSLRPGRIDDTKDSKARRETA